MGMYIKDPPEGGKVKGPGDEEAILINIKE